MSRRARKTHSSGVGCGESRVSLFHLLFEDERGLIISERNRFGNPSGAAELLRCTSDRHSHRNQSPRFLTSAAVCEKFDSETTAWAGTTISVISAGASPLDRDSAVVLLSTTTS